MGRGLAARRLGVPFLFCTQQRPHTERTEEEHRGHGERGAVLKDQRYIEECREKKNPLPGFNPLPPLAPLLHSLRCLLVFLVDVEDGAVFVEGYVERFGFFYEDVGELIFLG
jgi:hypothetical protein